MISGQTILRVDSSTAGDQSATRKITQAIVDGLVSGHPGAAVMELDLARNPIEHLQGRPDGENAYLDQFLDADTIVIGAPMYNFTIPSQLKAWIDRVVVAGKTFRYAPDGKPVGLAGDKRVIVACAAGGVHGGDTDFVDPYLRLILGFMGIGEPSFIHAHGMALGEVGQRALAAAVDHARQAGVAA